MIQRFWDSAMALGSMDDETETQSLMSDATRSQIFFEKEAARSQMMSEVIHEAAEPPYPALFSFKLQDRRGRMHRFSCGTYALPPTVPCSPSPPLTCYLSSACMRCRGAELDAAGHLHTPEARHRHRPPPSASDLGEWFITYGIHAMMKLGKCMHA